MVESFEILKELKKRRESLGLSIEDLHSKTKIRIQILKQIDSGDLSNIEPIYANSFIKSICTVLKYEKSEIVEIVDSLGFNIKQKEYSANIISSQPDFSKSVFKNQNTTFSKIKSFLDVKYLNYAIYFFIFVLIVSIIYFSFFSEPINPELAASKKIDTLMIANKSNDLVEHFVADSLILEARGIDTAWLRLQIDGKHSEQIVMMPKMERQWTASKFIQLSVGNGGAIEFKRNGKILEPFGTKGSVVRNVRITSTEVVVSSAPWNPNNELPEQQIQKKQSKKKKEEQKPQNEPPKRLGESQINTAPVQIKK